MIWTTSTCFSPDMPRKSATKFKCLRSWLLDWNFFHLYYRIWFEHWIGSGFYFDAVNHSKSKYENMIVSFPFGEWTDKRKQLEMIGQYFNDQQFSKRVEHIQPYTLDSSKQSNIFPKIPFIKDRAHPNGYSHYLNLFFLLLKMVLSGFICI